MSSAVIHGNIVNTIMLDMEYGIYEEIHKNKDDSFSIFLNSRYNSETLRDAYLHAVDHILRDDWENDDVQIIEAEAHDISRVEESEERINKYAEIIERLRNERVAVQRRLRKYEKKYADMSSLEIAQHNDLMLDKYERCKANPKLN